MKRIVIIDDSQAFRSQLKGILLAAGYDVVAEAENGQVGIEQCHAYHPELVTLDIGMPIMDGMTALKQLRSELTAVKVIMISACSDSNKVMEALTLGAAYYILKPCDANYITTIVARVLDQ